MNEDLKKTVLYGASKKPGNAGAVVLIIIIATILMFINIVTMS